MSTHPNAAAIGVEMECESKTNMELVQERLGITLSDEPTVRRCKLTTSA